MTTTYTLHHLNQAEEKQFIEILAGIFEHSPWIAQQVYALRPFDSLESLHAHMFEIVRQASREKRLELICKHPELAGSEAASGQLTTESKDEQASAGLDHCSPEELSRLKQLNRAYREKFGFPFVIAVKRLTRDDILRAMVSRLSNDSSEEFGRSINEIGKIAWLRLSQLITEA